MLADGNQVDSPHTGNGRSNHPGSATSRGRSGDSGSSGSSRRRDSHRKRVDFPHKAADCNTDLHVVEQSVQHTRSLAIHKLGDPSASSTANPVETAVVRPGFLTRHMEEAAGSHHPVKTMSVVQSSVGQFDQRFGSGNNSTCRASHF